MIGNFFWQQFNIRSRVYEPDKTTVRDFIKLPSTCNGYNLNGQTLGSYDYVTYRLKVLTKGNIKQLAIGTYYLHTAFRILVRVKEIDR